jgi:hypothetical protein
MTFMTNYNSGKMKNLIVSIILLILIPVISVSGQNSNLERLDAYKVGFFTKKLNLTPQEAEKFWPVINEYQRQKNQLQVYRVSLIREFNQSESTISDAQAAEIGDKLVATIVKENELSVTLHKQLKEVLPPAKVIRFYQAENQYKAQLLNELQGARQEQQTIRQNQRKILRNQ